MRFQSETCVFKFLQRNVHQKHLMRFQSETSVFKFLRRIACEWTGQARRDFELDSLLVAMSSKVLYKGCPDSAETVR